ncbi:hypothetical protein ACFQ4N_03750 [Oceanobacillus iheyensis]|uniref:hypothetical protein n=1 Tax=Oceanobacillus iheyensis TaxID=182710 RepID=UPI00135F1185|nr:hypothetical protein [Oceanobacillus iheyensis]
MKIILQNNFSTKTELYMMKIVNRLLFNKCESLKRIIYEIEQDIEATNNRKV